MTGRILRGHVIYRLRELPAGSVHVAVTSPPFWGLRAYKTDPQTWADGWRGELGSEPTIETFLVHLVEVFREVRRVLRPDASLWVEIGDTYAASGRGGGGGSLNDGDVGKRVDGGNSRRAPVAGLKQGDLCMVPARFALAMQADGWTLRSEMVWAKGISGRACEPQPCKRCGQMNAGWSGSPMPESVSGVRWERHRVKVSGGLKHSGGTRGAASGQFEASLHTPGREVKWQDCPGCAKCSPHGGYVLRRGSWRPTRAHTMVYLFTMGEAWLDGEGVKEDSVYAGLDVRVTAKSLSAGQAAGGDVHAGGNAVVGSVIRVAPTRNLRDVLTFAPEPLRHAHYAAYPTALPALAIRAGTSERGVCPKCGSQWARAIERTDTPQASAKGSRFDAGKTGERDGGERTQNGERYESRTVAWRPTCSCDAGEPVPATVLDPFLGSGSTAIAAERLGRNWIGCELQQAYVAIAEKRIAEARGSMFSGACHEAATSALGRS